MKESRKKPKRYDKAAHGRKMARAIVGQPQPKAQKRQQKHKKPLLKEGTSQ